ncbi:peroxidase 12, partial [Tanacetum coccineum]
MAMAFIKASCLSTLIFSILLLSNLRALEAQTPAPAPGLSYTFYRTTCPNLETIVRQQLQTVFASDIGQAAGLLRLHFHDCFVQGCDGSVLLDGSASGPSEKDAPPNLSLRAQAFVIIENLRRLVHNACNRTVSCADITALAARDAVFLSGGPNYSIPLGRRDGLTFATRNETLANLPPPSANATTILSSLATKGFTPTDVVALSGGHTIGIAHCTSFTNRLYPSRDPSMDQTFYNNLRLTCPTTNSTNTTFMDIRSPNVFDNSRYLYGDTFKASFIPLSFAPIKEGSRINSNMSSIVEVYDAKVSMRTRLYILKSIAGKLALKPKRYEIFRSIVFGRWLDLRTEDHDNHMIHYLLQHQRYVKDPRVHMPFIFDIGPHTIEFGRREFCLITGFVFGDCSLDHLNGGESAFRDRVFPNISNVKGDMLYKILNNQSNFDKLLDDDVVRLCLLLALDFVFMGYEMRHVIANELLNLVDDLAAWNDFPWGEHMWIELHHRVYNNDKKYREVHLKKLAINGKTFMPTYTLQGFVFAFK